MNHLPAGFLRTSGPRAGEVRRDNDNDPKLTFMLAQQATARLQFEARNLVAAASGRNPELARAEAQLAIDQIAALRARVSPLQHGTRDAVCFEAQEILAALDGVQEQLEQVTHGQGGPVARNAAEIAARLLGRRH